MTILGEKYVTILGEKYQPPRRSGRLPRPPNPNPSRNPNPKTDSYVRHNPKAVMKIFCRAKGTKSEVSNSNFARKAQIDLGPTAFDFMVEN